MKAEYVYILGGGKRRMERSKNRQIDRAIMYIKRSYIDKAGYNVLLSRRRRRNVLKLLIAIAIVIAI